MDNKSYSNLKEALSHVDNEIDIEFVLKAVRDKMKTPDQSSMFIKVVLAQQGIIFENEGILQAVYDAIILEQNMHSLLPVENLTEMYEGLKNRVKMSEDEDTIS